MATNTINTRIQLKYDTINHWITSTFIPKAGEVCIAVIPNGNTAASGHDKDVYDPSRYPYNNDTDYSLSGLSPYAIGVKVGDGFNRFINLPWIQAIAGDVYGWAKGSSPGSSITVNYGDNNTVTLQSAIDTIKESLGGIVSSGVSADALSTALAQLAQQTGGTSTLFTSNTYITDENNNSIRQYPTQIIRSITKDGLNITVTADNLAFEDLPIEFNRVYNASTNKAATMADITAEVTSYVNRRLSNPMNYLGKTSTAVTDGGTESPTLGGTITVPTAGDVVLYGNQEFLWVSYTNQENQTVSHWELLGDQGSYAIKGSIVKNDLADALKTEINGKLDSTTAASTYVAQESGKGLSTEDYTTAEQTKLAGIEAGADVNVIESISVNGSAQTPNNKNVEITIPLIGLNSSNGTTATAVTPAQDKTITLDEIAFDGNVSHLKQTTTILVFDCGNASDKLFE